MLSNYSNLLREIEGMKEKLEQCAKKLDEIKPEEMEKYENPQYRMWSGDIKNIEEFVNRLEEWLEEPRAAEAKKYLLDLKEWAENKEVSLEEIEKDWKFLSNSVDDIKDIHKQIQSISYASIKKKTANWVLNRIAEKDIEKARIWAINASKFSNDLKKLEGKEVKYDLAEKVKRDAISELLSKVTSFDEDKSKEIAQYNKLVDRADEIVETMPKEITEEVVAKTYRIKREEGIEKSLDTISEIIETIKTNLINIEWVIEFTNFKNFEDYSEIWKEKQNAMKKGDLEAISKALSGVIRKANSWKESKIKEINNALSKIERMVQSVEKNELKQAFEKLNKQARSIDWDKPDVHIIFEIITQANSLAKKIRDELVEELQNKDAISILEEPEIVKDLGKSKGWDFDRFFEALRIVLMKGLIEIGEIRVGGKEYGER